jgi:hypothetical protein
VLFGIPMLSTVSHCEHVTFLCGPSCVASDACLVLTVTMALGRLAMEDEGEPEGELCSLNMETGLGMK